MITFIPLVQGNVQMYRVFGSPFNLSYHQSVSYLRLKKVPFKVHNGSLTSTKLLSMWHRAKMSFCTTSPQRESLLLIHHVLENCESAAASANLSRSAANLESSSDPISGVQPTRILLSAEQYPKMNLAMWAIFLYSSSWLGSTGSMYRWVHGKGSTVVHDYVSYLSRATSIVPGVGSLVAPRVRNLMLGALAEIGIVQEAEPYMIEHFFRLCDALEAHFTEINKGSDGAISHYLLGTAHPTLADVAMAAAFDGYFLRDDPPALDVITKYPHLNSYLRLITEMATVEGVTSPSTLKVPQPGESVPGADGFDFVLPTLLPILDLATEIFPWQIAQCDALKQHAKKGLKSEKVTVVDVKTEMPLTLWGRRGTVDGASGSKGKLTAKLVLPKVKSAPYIMLVDRSIIPAHTRSQEVELAQVCGLGAIGAYPLFGDAEGRVHSCAGCSTEFMADLSWQNPSQKLYSMATALIEKASTTSAGQECLPAATSIDFDTHHVKSSEAAKLDATVQLKKRARRTGGNQQAYDVKRVVEIASDSAQQKVREDISEPKIDSEMLLEPSNSIDFALARVAMLLGRMRIEEFEVRSMYRNKGVEFALIPGPKGFE